MHPVRFVAIAMVTLAASASAQNGNGGIASFNAHRYDEARQQLELAVAANPNDAQAHHYLGRIAMHDTDFRGAISHLEKAASLEPSVAEHQILLGRAYGQLAVRSGMTKKFGLAKRARAALERAVELDPESIEARSGLIQFHLLAPGIVGGSSSKASAHATEIAKRNPFRGALARAWIAEVAPGGSPDAGNGKQVTASRGAGSISLDRFLAGAFFVPPDPVRGAS